MSKPNPNPVTVKTTVTITASIDLTEGQLRALDAMVGYGADAFLTWSTEGRR